MGTQIYWRRILFALIVFGTLKFQYAQAQNDRSIVVVPLANSKLSSDASWRIADLFDQYIRAHYSFSHLNEEALDFYFQKHSLPANSLAATIKPLAANLGVQQILLSQLSIKGKYLQITASLYDTRIGSVTKTVTEKCVCKLQQIELDMFRRIASSLFDAPEIILAGMANSRSKLALPKPVVLSPKRKKDIADKSVRPKSRIRRPASRNGGWKKFAFGALIVGGSAAYLVVQGNDDNAVINAKLPGAPPVPGS